MTFPLYCLEKCPSLYHCRITLADIQPMSADLVSALLEALNHPGSAENEYIMKGH
jgi:hypothetical protein